MLCGCTSVLSRRSVPVMLRHLLVPFGEVERSADSDGWKPIPAGSASQYRKPTCYLYSPLVTTARLWPCCRLKQLVVSVSGSSCDHDGNMLSPVRTPI